MFERQWDAVPPTLFTQDGSTNGYIVVASSRGFRVKSQVVISATGQPNLTLQLKRVLSDTQMVVGPLNGAIGNSNVDLSAYTLAAGAFIYQDQQARVTIQPTDIVQAVYEQEPVVAIRTTSVDDFGNVYDVNNPLPVAFDGTISIGNVSIIDDGNTMTVNPNGSINVNVVESPVVGQTVKSLYNQVFNIGSGVETTLVTYTVPAGYTAILEKVSASGENIARFDVLYNNALFDTRRTYYGSPLTTDFDYTTGTANGFILNSGDNIIIQVLHNRPYVGTFNARLQVLEMA
jgi:hypothetical protein